MSERWPGGLISKTPVTPTGPSYNGTAPGIWTIDQMNYWKSRGLWPDPAIVPDQYWSYVSYLLSTTATNAQQNNTFLDSSTNNFTITRFGNTTQGSATPYGTLWSNYFDGSGDLLSVPSNAAFSFGTGDFTIECWLYFTSYGSGNQNILDFRGSAGSGSNIALYLENVGGSGTKQLRAFNGAGDAAATASNFPLNTWSHVAITRSSNSFRFFVNGAQVGSTTTVTTSYANTAGLYIGAYAGNVANFFGNLSNVRVIKGTALYTAAFTPPAAPLTAITNTSLLTCQSNRFKDNSTNNFAITKNGDTKVTAFSPFILAYPGYTTTANGGSGYFDGFGDYLTAPANAAFALGSGDFTLECWAYNSEVARNVGYMGVWSTSYILYREATAYKFYYSGPGGSPLSPSIPAVANAWTHLAVVRNGSTLTFYVNGAVGASTNVGTTAISNGSTQPMYIGANQDGPFSTSVDGYMAGARLVKGTAVYTAAFTPPTTPPTAVSGTSILCNFTNAGLYDAAVQNNMETVGNAQVSTGQAKYGTTSAYFDGSGDGLQCLSPNPSLVNANFTWEGWVNFNSLAGNPCLINVGATSSDRTLLYFDATNGIRYAVARGNVDQISIQQGSTSGWSTGVWYHVALVRNGNTYTIYRDGTSVATGTNAYAQSILTTGFTVGYSAGGLYLNGYIDDLRVTNGVARYTASFTPPTAALPVY